MYRLHLVSSTYRDVGLTHAHAHANATRTAREKRREGQEARETISHPHTEMDTPAAREKAWRAQTQTIHWITGRRTRADEVIVNSNNILAVAVAIE